MKFFGTWFETKKNFEDYYRNVFAPPSYPLQWGNWGTGLSSDKGSVLGKYQSENELKPEDVFRNTYLLEFLGLEEKPSYSESDLEESIITNLQNFLIEMGRGFCFEARQKRITFDNKHYRIDLVFYHRILKCSCLQMRDRWMCVLIITKKTKSIRAIMILLVLFYVRVKTKP